MVPKIALTVDEWYEVVSTLYMSAADSDDAELDVIADKIHDQLYEYERKRDATNWFRKRV